MPIKKRQPTYSASGLPFDIIHAAEASPYLRLGIYGPSGVGKTYLAGTANWYEGSAPVLMIDFYDSSDTVLGEPVFGEIDVIKIRSLDELDKVYDWLYGVWTSGEVFPYKTIVLDEIDEAHTDTLREIMYEVVSKNASRNIDLASQQEWGIARNKFLRIVDGFRALPCNLIYLSVPGIKDDKVRSEKEIMTFGLPGKLSDDIMKRLGVVAYLDKEEKKVRVDGEFKVVVKRILKFEAGLKARSKVRGPSRADRLGEDMEDPTVEKIFHLWYGD